MEDSLLSAVLVGGLAGIPLMILGYLIGVKQKRHLLASWDDTSYRDPKIVGCIMGVSVLLTGFLILSSSIGLMLHYLSLGQALWAVSSAVVLPLLAGLYVNLKYAK